MQTVIVNRENRAWVRRRKTEAESDIFPHCSLAVTSGVKRKRSNPRSIKLSFGLLLLALPLTLNFLSSVNTIPTYNYHVNTCWGWAWRSGDNKQPLGLFSDVEQSVSVCGHAGETCSHLSVINTIRFHASWWWLQYPWMKGSIRSKTCKCHVQRQSHY